MRRWFAALLFALAAVASAADAPPTPPASLGNALRVSVLTFAPGDTYWQRFGHNAILVENTATGANAVYNYGMFDFFQQNFFLNFARGKMLYRLDVDTLDRTLAMYQAEGRWVRQQVLALSPQQRLDLTLFLEDNRRPENAQYYYDYFRDNCSTRVRDAVDRVLGGALATTLKAQSTTTTYRREATRLMRPIVPLAIGMDALLGPAADLPLSRWQQSFVPEVLMAALEDQRIGGQPLVAESRLLLPDTGRFVAPAAPLSLPIVLWPVGLVLGGLLAFAGLRRSRWPFGLLAAPVLVVAGLGGVILALAWTASDHWAIHRNFQLALFSPLAFVLLPVVWRRRRNDAPAQPTRGWSISVLYLWFGTALAATVAGAFWQATLPAWGVFWLLLIAGLGTGIRQRT